MVPSDEFYFTSHIAILDYPRRARYLQLRDVAVAREVIRRITTERSPVSTVPRV